MENIIIALIYVLPIFFVYHHRKKSNRSIAWVIGSVFIPILFPLIYFVTNTKYKEKQKRAGIIHTEVTEMNVPNEDGTDRKEIIVRAGEGAHLQLQQELQPSMETNTVAVYTLEGKQIGYLNKEDMGEVAKHLENGGEVDVKIIAIVRDIDHDVKKCLIRISKKRRKKVG